MVALLLASLSFALAGEPVPARTCDYPVADWALDVGQIEAALARGDLREAATLVDVMDREWACLSAPVPRHALARFAQVRAFLAWNDLDVDEAVRWTRAARFADPNTPWLDGDASQGALALLDQAGRTHVVTLPPRVAHPPRGGVFIDGRFATTATAPEDTPILVQIFDHKGDRIDAFWNDGPELPAPWLANNVDLARPPRWWED